MLSNAPPLAGTRRPRYFLRLRCSLHQVRHAFFRRHCVISLVRCVIFSGCRENYRAWSVNYRAGNANYRVRCVNYQLLHKPEAALCVLGAVIHAADPVIRHPDRYRAPAGAVNHALDPVKCAREAVNQPPDAVVLPFPPVHLVLGAGVLAMERDTRRAHSVKVTSSAALTPLSFAKSKRSGVFLSPVAASAASALVEEAKRTGLRKAPFRFALPRLELRDLGEQRGGPSPHGPRSRSIESTPLVVATPKDFLA